MASSTILSSHFTSQTTSVAQTAVSTTTPTLAWVIPEESLAIFASDHIPDFYYDGYSQDEADVVTLFLGVSAVVYLIGYITSLLILRHRRNKRRVWRDAMTEYYRSGGIPPRQPDRGPTYITGTPNSPDPDANPYDSQSRAPYMSQLQRPPSSCGESPVLHRSRVPATLSQVNSLGSEVPTAITSPVQSQRPLEVAQPPVLPSAETLI